VFSINNMMKLALCMLNQCSVCWKLASGDRSFRFYNYKAALNMRPALKASKRIIGLNT
jgi:hypothetical protein